MRRFDGLADQVATVLDIASNLGGVRASLRWRPVLLANSGHAMALLSCHRPSEI
jgi:hypothetical protein